MIPRDSKVAYATRMRKASANGQPSIASVSGMAAMPAHSSALCFQSFMLLAKSANQRKPR